jgi:RHS repeat-associated protein
VIPLGQRAASGWLHYIHDANGSPVQIVDDRGQSVSRLQSTLFGRTQTRGGVSTPFRLPGQWDDPETGLHYNRYRYYDPEAGRFISPDPIGLNGSINLYSLGPNPVGWSDPMGWQHMMTVTSNTGPGGAQQPWGGPSGMAGGANQVVGQPGQYQSGLQGDGNPCPDLLSNRANCHTEQRFADDLIRAHRAGEVQPGQQFNLTGTFPPCPNCHAAMRRAAAETGTKVTYNWEKPKGTHNSVTYHGDAEPKFSDTPHAQVLQKAGYNTQKDQGTFLHDDGWQKGDSTRWGYQSQQGAHQAYSNLMNTGGYRP